MSPMSGSDVEAMMATMTYYVALAFMRSEDGSIVACEPKEACSSDQAIRMASSLAAMEGHWSHRVRADRGPPNRRWSA